MVRKKLRKTNCDGSELKMTGKWKQQSTYTNYSSTTHLGQQFPLDRPKFLLLIFQS